MENPNFQQDFATLWRAQREQELGGKELPIYDHYVAWCERCGCEPASPVRWHMETQKIPNV